MKGSYAIHGRVIQTTSTESNTRSISFELLFPEDWNLIERQLSKATQGFAQLHLDALQMDILDDIDDSILCKEVPFASIGIQSIH